MFLLHWCSCDCDVKSMLSRFYRREGENTDLSDYQIQRSCNFSLLFAQYVSLLTVSDFSLGCIVNTFIKPLSCGMSAATPSFYYSNLWFAYFTFCPFSHPRKSFWACSQLASIPLPLSVPPPFQVARLLYSTDSHPIVQHCTVWQWGSLSVCVYMCVSISCRKPDHSTHA